MALKYLVPGGNGLWSNSNNWSLTSGGASGAGAPNAVDDVIFDANSLHAPMTVNVTSNCTSVYMSGYTGTVTYTAALNVLSSFEYSSGMTTAGASTLGLGNNTSTPSSTCSVNFNGVTHNAALSFANTNGANCVYTITGNLNVIGTVSFSNNNTGGAGSKSTINGGDVLCNSSLSIYGNGNRWINGTSNIRLVGTGNGNFTSGVNAYITGPDVYLEKTGGVINMTVGALYPRNISVFYVSGNYTNFILQNNNGLCTLDTNNFVWSSVGVGGGTGISLSSQLNVSGTFTNNITLSIGGTGGINCANLTTTGSLTFPAGSVTNISNTLTSVGTAAAPIVIGSSVSTVKANMILSNSGNQDVSHTSGRDIDSDGGTTIMSYRAPSITRCDNWTTLPVITSINTNSILR